jgi:C-terminal processing protease CtpA/Prc
LLNELVESKRFREETLAEKKAREEKEAENKQYTDFLEAYPDVKPEDIPVEVWKEHKAGRNLLDAYIRYENQRLKDEMAKYQTQQQIEQANSKNAASSTGSAKTSGKTGGFISKEDFEANKHDMKWVQKNLSILEESRRHW